MDSTRALTIGPEHLEDPGGFVWFSRAWYAQANRPTLWHDEVLILVPDEYRSPLEVPVRWWALGSGHVARLEVFDESWEALLSNPVLCGLLRDAGAGLTPAGLCEALVDAGYSDETPREER